MNKVSTASLGIAAMTFVALAFAASPASAQMTEETARASLVPFYKALNAANAREAPELIRQSTTPEWVTCRGNDLCNSRDEVMAAIGQRLRNIPDLKWEIKEVLVAGDRVIVRGEATGTPTGELMGSPTNGKSFKLMSLDVHTLIGGKITRTYHVEDWQGAFRQMAQK
jgi:predicted ester cyclase